MYCNTKPYLLHYLNSYIVLSADTIVNHVSFDGRSALLLATEQGHYESMELLLAHNADPNLGDAMQTYPILAGMESL